MARWKRSVVGLVVGFVVVTLPLIGLGVRPYIASVGGGVFALTVVALWEWLDSPIDFNGPVPIRYQAFMPKHLRLLPMALLDTHKIQVKVAGPSSKNLVRVRWRAKVRATLGRT